MAFEQGADAAEQVEDGFGRGGGHRASHLSNMTIGTGTAEKTWVV
jgi:hypothetical protein